jgi:hypothetical protein
MKKTLDKAAEAGRFGDNQLLHVSDREIAGLEAILGKTLPTNPKTGLKEAFFFLPFLAGLGAAAAPAAAAGTAAAGTAAGLGAGAGLAGALGTVGATATPALMGAAAAPVAAAAPAAAGTAAAGLGALTPASLATPLGATMGAGAMTPALTGAAPAAAAMGGKGLMAGLGGALGQIGQLAPLALMMPRGGGSSKKSEKKDLSNVKYEGNAPTFPGSSYRPGIDPEWDYFRGGGLVKSYAEGGMVKEEMTEIPTTPRMSNPESGLQMNERFTNYIPQRMMSFMQDAIEANKKKALLNPQNLAGGGMPRPGPMPRPMPATAMSSMPATAMRPGNLSLMQQTARAQSNAPTPVPTAVSRPLPMASGLQPMAIPGRPGGTFMGGRSSNFAEGGLASLMGSKKNSTEDDSELIAATVEALQGQRQDAEQVISLFVETFGETALQDLIARLKQGQAPSDGQSDSIPANLSEGEYVLSADVVSGLGNGSTDAGGQVLDGMVNRVRSLKGGSPQQAGPMDPNSVMPV